MVQRGSIKKCILFSIFCQGILATDLEKQNILIIEKKITPCFQKVNVFVSFSDERGVGDEHTNVEYGGGRVIKDIDESFCILQEKIKEFACDNNINFGFDKSWHFTIHVAQVGTEGICTATVSDPNDNSNRGISLYVKSEKGLRQLIFIYDFCKKYLNIDFINMSDLEKT